jgi:hypothetical protein
MPAPLFSKVYMDTMHMLLSGGFKYIMQGRCSLAFFPEWRILKAENAVGLGNWMFQDFLRR